MKNDLEHLNEISKSKNFLEIIASIVYNDIINTSLTVFQNQSLDRLLHNELCLVIGLWLKNYNQKDETTLDIDDKSIRRELDKIHQSYAPHISDNFETAKKKSILEIMFYSSDGAYGDEYLNFLKHKYKYDNLWLNDKLGINICDGEIIVNNAQILIERRINQSINKKTKKSYLSNFIFTHEELTNNKLELSNLLNQLTLTIGSNININQHFNQIGDYNIYREKPIIKISDNEYFIPSLYAITETLYESPFYWMNKDENYEQKALKHRGLVAEEITYNILRHLFGKKNIFRNVKIFKKKAEIITDIDLLLIHEEKAIIFQVKSKKLTINSKKGSLEAIENDFNLAIKNAIEQGENSIKCLKDCEQYKFISNDDLTIEDIKKIKNYYNIPILLDSYMGLHLQSHILLQNNTKTIPLTIFDLNLIITKLNSKEKFIDYIVTRINTIKNYIAENETAYLAYYLNGSLTQIGDHKLIALDNSWGNKVDQMHYETSQSKNKTGRNDLCGCGSNIKFKKCCLIKNKSSKSN